MTYYSAIFEPLPWHIPAMRDMSPVLLLTGGTGGGKSVLGLNKMHALMLRYAGASGMFIRKTKASLANTVVEPFLEIVGETSAIKYIASRSRIEYANGSRIYLAGVENKKQRDRLKSIGRKGGIDFTVCEEATELEEADFNMIRTRMRGRAASWNQVILMTNPESPDHWIYRRLIAGGEASVYESVAAQNYHNPDHYLTTLDTLTGVDKDRLAHGKWVKSTGLIFGVWSETENVLSSAEYIPDGGKIVWAIDDGYSGERASEGFYTAKSHPRVILICQVRNDGRIVVIDEDHAIEELEDTHLERALALPYPRPYFVVVDKSAAQLKGRINALGLHAINGAAQVEESIKTLRAMLAADRNGYRRIIVNPRCALLRSEMLSYRRDDKQEIVKAYDHAIDALRYLAWVLRHE